MRKHDIELPADPRQVLGVVGEAAEVWGAKWEKRGTGGQLRLPVIAGLRRGWLQGQLFAEPAREGSRLVLLEEECRYRIHVPTFVVLLLGGMGGLLTVVIPFYPQLLPLTPGAVVLVLSAWFLVVARLRHRGGAEFLSMVRELYEERHGAADEETRIAGG